MSNDTMNYDYTALRLCVEAMQRAAHDIEEDTNELKKGAAQLEGAGWKGKTADAYKLLADDLAMDLLANKERLESLKMALQDGVGNMQFTDRSGAKHF